MLIWGNLRENPTKNNLIAISGVPGTASAVYVEFKEFLSKDKLLFPTGNLIDELYIENSNKKLIKATLISGSNPMIIITPDVLGLLGSESPKNIDYPKIKNILDEILEKSADKMKIKITESLKVSWVSKPLPFIDSSGNKVEKDSFDISCRITASNRIHHAITGTGAINLGVSCLIKGTIANNVIDNDVIHRNEIIIGHPGGIMKVDSAVQIDEKTNRYLIKRAGFIRTARLIMDGYVYY